MAGIYIHIPFCKQACTYCDFFFDTTTKYRDAFVPALVAEIESYQTKEESTERIETVYLGGGTPSRLTSRELANIFESLHRIFDISTDAEITMEVNPDDLNEVYLGNLKKIGINRLSVGVQTFDENLLKFMNRAHTKEEAQSVLQLISENGFRSWTADIIYGNPEQSIAMLEKDLEMMMKFNPPHISAYTLTVEPHTKLGSMVRKNVVNPADDEDVANQMEFLTSFFNERGIHRYEVSNFARKGHGSKHNSAYWEHVNYLGLGPAAHGFWWKGIEGRRTSNRANLRDYVQSPGNPSKDVDEQLTLSVLAEERLLIGLRTLKGVAQKELQNRYNYRLDSKQLDYINYLKENGFMKLVDDLLQLTDKGLAVADQITLQLISRGESGGK